MQSEGISGSLCHRDILPLSVEVNVSFPHFHGPFCQFSRSQSLCLAYLPLRLCFSIFLLILCFLCIFYIDWLIDYTFTYLARGHVARVWWSENSCRVASLFSPSGPGARTQVFSVEDYLTGPLCILKVTLFQGQDQGEAEVVL